ncbi:hypothetical protein [Alkalibacter mobilis]|nr:hypothetical protein [Alkalibacter mobilis]
MSKKKATYKRGALTFQISERTLQAIKDNRGNFVIDIVPAGTT